MTASALVTTDLVKHYRSSAALGGVTLSIAEGELVGLLGPNGAGKSTLVKIGCGLVRPTSGHAEVCGAPAGSAEARAAIGYLAELFRFPGWLTADDVIALHQQLTASGGDASERTELLRLVGLEDAHDKRVDQMSKGMQQRLGIAQALVGGPRLLMLDEPTSALDPEGRHVVRALLRELRDRGIAVLLNSHLLSEVELTCDRVFILSKGVIVAEGTPADITATKGVEIDTDTGVQTWPEATREDVPELVEQLVRARRSIYGVRTMRRTLEDVYLETMRDGLEGPR